MRGDLLRFVWQVSLLSALLLGLSRAQEYGEYARGAVGRRRNNNFWNRNGNMILGGAAVGGLFSWVATAQTMKRKYGAEKKELMQYIQLQNEVYREREKQWQQEYQKLFKQYEQLEKETVERDYEEFKAPDTNNDDMISRAEFNTYVAKYLSSFDNLNEKDFPRFDDFDLDGDGLVSFDEWQEFLQLQKLQESKKKDAGKKDSHYGDVINALYESSSGADSFNGVQKNLATKSRRQ